MNRKPSSQRKNCTSRSREHRRPWTQLSGESGTTFQRRKQIYTGVRYSRLCRGPCAIILRPPDMSLTAGVRLGPYEILAPLGAGGMGEVYRARDTRLDRAVAIKVLPAHLSDNPELRQRFEREA